MRGLQQLINTTEGKDFLAREGVFWQTANFLHALKPSAHSKINPRQSTSSLTVYAHQQPYLDYRYSVVSKFLLLKEITLSNPKIQTDFLWIDTDCAASDKLALRIYWQLESKQIPVRFAPPHCERHESRFINMDSKRLNHATHHLGSLVLQDRYVNIHYTTRFKQLEQYLLTEDTLSSYSRRISDFLLKQTLNYVPTPILVSDLIQSGALIESLELLINSRIEFINEINSRIDLLNRMNVTTAVKPLPQNYLPLFYNCPVDNSRLRMQIESQNGTHYAVAKHHSGEEYRFYLGKDKLVLTELCASSRWSPDVTLPILLNDYYSGLIAGPSSCLYMLAFRSAMIKALGLAPIPILVSDYRKNKNPKFQSLMQTYLSAQTL